MRKKLTSEQFIAKAKKIWGDKYNYSLVKYDGKRNRVKIIYNGIVLEQTPEQHLSGRYIERHVKMKTTEEFIESAKKIWGDKYNYSITEYKNNCTKIKFKYKDIIYEQMPNVHLNGHPPKNLRNNINYFLEESIKIHGNKYNYSLVDYKSPNKKIKIIYQNKIYEQTPQNHLEGKFPEIICRKFTKEEFINKCRKVHGTKYDYSLINEYSGYYETTIKIIFEGKIYEQSASAHLRGCEPPEISPMSKGEERIKKYLDINNISYYRKYMFNDCKNEKHLFFDFYLQELNLLIEFDGEQHFRSVEYFGGENMFKLLIKRDQIKNRYAFDNNIKLLRISYKNFHNIEQILEENI